MTYTVTDSPVTETPLVDVRGLGKSFGGLTVLDGVDLTVTPGEILALLGPNGAGKTTTVRILATLLPFDSGTATIAGHNLRTCPEGVRHSISLTGQYAAVDDVLTGEENLLMMARLRHLGRTAARPRVRELLAEFGLGAARERKVATYSGGMRRRLDLAASLITQPPLVFLDEPTTGLDPRSREAMWDAVRALVADGTTIILTTQYLEEADQLADRVVLLDDGRVIASGTPHELKSALAGDVLELVFADDAAYERAVQALRTPATHAEDARTLGVPTDGTGEHVRAVLDLLRAHDVEVARLSVHRPTLDDVFLTLTARVGADR